MRKNPVLCAAVATLSWMAVAPPASAETVDLTGSTGASGDANGALFFNSNPRPTGTGVIDPFLRIQANNREDGFNTDAKKPALDAKAGLWTHSLLVSDVPILNINGRDYLEFLLDINEVDHDNPAPDPAYFLTLHEMQLYVADSGDINDLATLQSESKVFDLDDGADADSRVDLRYHHGVGWGTGSGSGDMYAYVPQWLTYQADTSRNLYLYSAFGTPFSSSDGFEEWAVEESATVIPLPASVWSGLGLLGVLGAARMRKARQV